MKKQTAIIYDIDGVLVNSSERLKKYIKVECLRANDYWGYARSLLEYSKTVEGDTIIQEGIQLINLLSKGVDHCIGLTSRGEFSREATETFLHPHLDFKIELVMRKELFYSLEGDIIDSSARFIAAPYKKKMAKSLMALYDIKLAIDDNIELCEMYNSLGIPVLHFMYPGIDFPALEGNKQLAESRGSL